MKKILIAIFILLFAVGQGWGEVYLTDTFDDDSLDTSKWTESIYAGSLVAEQNNRLELISNSNDVGSLRSDVIRSPQNTQVIIKATQI